MERENEGYDYAGISSGKNQGGEDPGLPKNIVDPGGGSAHPISDPGNNKTYLYSGWEGLAW